MYWSNFLVFFLFHHVIEELVSVIDDSLWIIFMNDFLIMTPIGIACVPVRFFIFYFFLNNFM